MSKKTTKKQSKKTVKTAKPTSLSKPMTKKSVIEHIKEPVKQPKPQETTAIVEKLPIDICSEAFDFFQYAFQPEGFYDDEGAFFTSDRFLAMWKSFLVAAGWDEDEYWACVEDLPHAECEDCKKEREEKAVEEAKEKAKNVN